jgi:CxxC motif-containing protein
MQQATEIKTFTCICCPLGCDLEASFSANGELESISGYACAQGKIYAEEESVAPRRMVCAAVCIEGSLEPLSVKTASPILKEHIPEALKVINKLELQAPITANSILLNNIANTDVALLATKTIQRGAL